MEIDIGLVLKIAGVGVLVSVISSILTKSGKDEQAMLVTVGGIVAVMLMLERSLVGSTPWDHKESDRTEVT